MDGEPGLSLTGHSRREKESAEIALSYVRANAAELGIDPSDVVGRRFHVHVPAGAVPKDGPSAGVTIATALVSLLTGRPVRGDVGMTGELTLQGRVLPPAASSRRSWPRSGRASPRSSCPAERTRPRRRPRCGAGSHDVPPRVPIGDSWRSPSSLPHRARGLAAA